MKQIKHQLSESPFYFPSWEVKFLLLGTFNPRGGEKVNYYYGRSRNQTWNIVSEIFKTSFDLSDSKSFFQKLAHHRIACVDMIHSVTAPDDLEKDILGKGYSDNKIINKRVLREYNTSRIVDIIDHNKNLLVFSTWGNGPSLKEWNIEIEKIEAKSKVINLVSPSIAARVPKGSNKFDYMLSDWSKKIVQ